MTTIVDEAGCIQLPEDVRTQLGVKPGDEVLLEARAGEWVLRNARAKTGLHWEGSVLVHHGTNAVGTTIEDQLDESRTERYERLVEGFTQ